jgi:hypothetical protein
MGEAGAFGCIMSYRRNFEIMSQLAVLFTHRQGLDGRIDGRENAKHAQSYVCGFLPPSTCAGLVMQHWRIDVAKRYAFFNIQRRQLVNGSPSS